MHYKQNLCIDGSQTTSKHFILDLLSEAASGRSESLMGKLQSAIEINTVKESQIWDIKNKLKPKKRRHKTILCNFSLGRIILNCM